MRQVDLRGVADARRISVSRRIIMEMITDKIVSGRRILVLHVQCSKFSGIHMSFFLPFRLSSSQLVE